MSLFSTPEQHAANGPDTWRVEKVRDGLWAIVTATGDPQLGGDRLETYPTRKSAVEGLTDGWAARLWEKERRWYAGESIPGWKSWAEVKAEHERIEARKAEREGQERRKIERQGITPENVTEWREALQGLHIERDSENPAPDDDDAAEVQRERLDDALTAMRAMLDHITSGSLMDPDLLDDDEAEALHKEISGRWAYQTIAAEWIDRIRYKGLDTELTALEVLERMERAA